MPRRNYKNASSARADGKIISKAICANDQSNYCAIDTAPINHKAPGELLGSTNQRSQSIWGEKITAVALLQRGSSGTLAGALPVISVLNSEPAWESNEFWLLGELGVWPAQC